MADEGKHGTMYIYIYKVYSCIIKSASSTSVCLLFASSILELWGSMIILTVHSNPGPEVAHATKSTQLYTLPLSLWSKNWFLVYIEKEFWRELIHYSPTVTLFIPTPLFRQQHNIEAWPRWYLKHLLSHPNNKRDPTTREIWLRTQHVVPILAQNRHISNALRCWTVLSLCTQVPVNNLEIIWKHAVIHVFSKLMPCHGQQYSTTDKVTV